MSDDLVRAEARSVRALRDGVERYAAQLRDAMQAARRDMGVAETKAEEAVAQRRAHAGRCEHELRQAQAALQRCQENCGGLQQQVAAAAGRHAEAQERLQRAQRAAREIASARSDLERALQSAQAVVGDHASVASSALAALESRLAKLPQMGFGHTLHQIAVSSVVTAEVISGTVGLDRAGADALRAMNVNLPQSDHSVSEMVEHREEQERDYVIKKDAEQRRHLATDDGEAEA